MKLVTYSKLHIGKLCLMHFLFRSFEAIRCLSLLFNFALQYAIRKIQRHVKGLELNGTHKLMFIQWAKI